MFSWRTTHPVALKSIAKVPNQKVARRPKCFSFFFFFFFRRASSNLRDSFTIVFAQNSSIFRWAVHQPIAFFHVHTGQFLNRSLKNYGFLYDAIFLPVYACVQNTRNVNITQDCWIRNTVGVRGVIEEILVWSVILEPILYRKPVRGDLLLCNRWQTSAQACICC